MDAEQIHGANTSSDETIVYVLQVSALTVFLSVAL